jgi:hypothetical protein
LASTAPKSEPNVKLSPLETRLFNIMKGRTGWVTTAALVQSEYGMIDSLWPINARGSIRVTMESIRKKLEKNDGRRRIEKRGGGRGGVEYRMLTKQTS